MHIKNPTLRQSKAQRGNEDSLVQLRQSASQSVLVQGLAHSAGACEQLLGHGLDLLAQTNGIQVNTEHIGAAVQLLQAAEVLLAFLDFQWSHDCLQLSQQRIGGGLESLTVIVDAPYALMVSPKRMASF